jgi:hypothetical protein
MKFWLFWFTCVCLIALLIWGVVLGDRSIIWIALCVLTVTVIGTLISDSNKG